MSLSSPSSLSSRQAAAETPIEPSQAWQALDWAVALSTEQPNLLNVRITKPEAAQWRAIPVEQLRPRLDQLMLGRYVNAGLEALRINGMLDAWLPEVAVLVGFGNGDFRHKDVWEHTKQVVWQSRRTPAVRWGALLHDIGKVKTRSIDARGQVHFLGHAEVGAAMFRKRIAKRLAFEGELCDRINFLIYNHLRASQYDGTWTDSAVRRFTKEMGAGLQDLLALSRADITTKRLEKRKRALRYISELSRRIKEVCKADAYVQPLPKGLGAAIIAHFDLKPSKLIGDLRHELEEQVAQGNLQSHQSDAYYLQWLEQQRNALGF